MVHSNQSLFVLVFVAVQRMEKHVKHQDNAQATLPILKLSPSVIRVARGSVRRMNYMLACVVILGAGVTALPFGHLPVRLVHLLCCNFSLLITLFLFTNLLKMT